MKIEDSFRLADRENSRMYPSGAPVSARTVASLDMDSLLARLEKEGIPIALDDSEKEIRYMINGHEKRSVVPYMSGFPGDVQVSGYILRNRCLEIALKDFHDFSGTGSGIGAPVRHDCGIECAVRYEGPYEEGKVVGKAREALKGFYQRYVYGDNAGPAGSI